MEYSNFNAKVVDKSFEAIKNLEKQSNYINKFILNLLQAYDKNNSRNDLLELAKALCNKLSLNELMENILINFRSYDRKKWTKIIAKICDVR